MKGLKEKGTNVSQRVESQDTRLNRRYKKQMEKTSQEKQKTREKDSGGEDEDDAWMCLRSIEAVGDAVELGEGILDEDLLDDPPDGRTVGDVVMYTSRHS